MTILSRTAAFAFFACAAALVSTTSFASFAAPRSAGITASAAAPVSLPPGLSGLCACDLDRGQTVSQPGLSAKLPAVAPNDAAASRPAQTVAASDLSRAVAQ